MGLAALQARHFKFLVVHLLKQLIVHKGDGDIASG
jgi:hypothetical protein